MNLKIVKLKYSTFLIGLNIAFFFFRYSSKYVTVSPSLYLLNTDLNLCFSDGQ